MVALVQSAPSQEPKVDTSAFSPIEDYGVVGDCRSAALISKGGSVDWLCWPRFDSPPVFAALLDPAGGRFAIRPGEDFTSERSYSPGSNMLVTRFRTSSGVIQLTDLFFAADEKTKRRDFLPWSMLIRKLEGLEGNVEVVLSCEPVRGYDRSPAPIKAQGPRSLTFPVSGGLAHLATGFDIANRENGFHGTCSLRQGEKSFAVLSLNENGPAIFPPLGRLDWLIETSDSFWRKWSAGITYDGPYRDAVVRSALALKLLSFSPSGAIIAAPTTSLPERVGAPYNWDYRYCWLRDASYTIRAGFGLGLHPEARAFLDWLLYATRLTLPELHVVYSVFGKDRLKERDLERFSGYKGSRPVRLGNAAHSQKQLDVYGEVLNAAVMCRDEGVRFTGAEHSFLESIAKYVLKHWRDPDDGIWETRLGSSHHVQSKVMCWVALDRAGSLARDGEVHIDPAELERAADEVKTEVQSRGFNEALGSYTATLDGSDLDAAVLTLPIVGFEDAASPRMTATIETLRRVLARDELVYRHQRSETGGEGAFLLCSFWLVQCLALAGRLDEAHALFERLLARSNDLGLYSEEIDVTSGNFLGNFHQAFTHVGLINAALTLREVSTTGGGK